jgi:choline-glycine betaine transporter
MEKKFQILRFVGTVYKVFGIIVGVITILAVIGACLVSVLGGTMMDQIQRELGGAVPGMNIVGGIVASLIALLYGGGLAITLYALGEGVYLLLALEENTRMTAQALSQSASYSPPPPPEVG